LLHDPPHHTTGEKVAAVLAAAATAAQKRVRSEPIGAAYDALKNAVSATARNEVEALEAAPHSRGRRMVVAEIVETQPAEDKKIFDDLANVLAARLHDHGLPVVVNTTGTSKWHTRVLSFGVLLLLSVAFGWIIEHLISDDERHTLVALQEELLDVVHSLTPWALASTFYEVFETTPVMPELPRLTSRQIDECANPLRYPEGRECLRDCYYSNGGFHRANAVSRKVPSQAVITPLNLCRLNCFESFSYKLFDLIGQAENPETCMSRCTYPPELFTVSIGRMLSVLS